MLTFINLIKKNYLVILLLSFFIILYLSTIYPGVGGRVNYGDSAKWQFLWAIGGTPHSTGYPLYLILSTIFGNTLIFLDPAIRVTMISVFSAIGTLFFLYKVSELLIENKFARILPSILLGTTYPFWSQATESEVYTLNSLFVSMVIYFMIKFYLSKNSKLFLIGIAIYSLSFGNHLTMITLLPAIMYIVFATDYKVVFSKKIISLSILFLTLGASQYLYVLYLSYQGSPYLEYIGQNTSISHWLSYITGGQFSNQIGGNNSFDLLYYKGSLKFITVLWKDLGWVFVIAALSYVLYQKINNEQTNRVIIFLALIGMFEFLNAVTYNIGDIIVYYIPIYLILLLLLVKFIDYLQSKTLQNLLVIIILLLSSVFTSTQYQKMSVVENTAYQEIQKYFTLVPDNEILFLPRIGFYHYPGYEASRYAQYVEYKNKNIHLIEAINKPYEILFVPRIFINKVPKEKYIIEPINKPKKLYDLIKDNQENLIIISARDEAQHGLNAKTKLKLKSIGLNLDKLAYRGSYVAVINAGNVIYEKVDNKGSVDAQNKSLNNLGINEITSAGFTYGNVSKIIYHGKDYSLNKRGLNLVIVKKDDSVKQFNIDTFQTDLTSPLLYKAILKKDNNDPL